MSLFGSMYLDVLNMTFDCVMSIHYFFRTMKLYKDQAQSVLEEYTGPRYEIEKKQLVVNVYAFIHLAKYLCNL